MSRNNVETNTMMGFFRLSPISKAAVETLLLSKKPGDSQGDAQPY
jgi:hypothetical protein